MGASEKHPYIYTVTIFFQQKIPKFYVLLTVHLGIIPFNDQLDAHFFLYMFISILYMFWVFKRSSSGDSVVLIRYLVYVTLCRWPSGTQVWTFCPNLHTRWSPTYSDIYQTPYWYNWISWWWALECSKHVENWNKHTQKELCVKLVIK